MTDKLTIPLAAGDRVRLKGQQAIGCVVRISPTLRAAILVSFPVGPARAERDRLRDALIAWIDADGTMGFADADEDLAALARTLKAREP